MHSVSPGYGCTVNNTNPGVQMSKYCSYLTSGTGATCQLSCGSGYYGPVSDTFTCNTTAKSALILGVNATGTSVLITGLPLDSTRYLRRLFRFFINETVSAGAILLHLNAFSLTPGFANADVEIITGDADMLPLADSVVAKYAVVTCGVCTGPTHMVSWVHITCGYIIYTA